eukprot:386323-Pleurochrysis_carterae.AAC.1
MSASAVRRCKKPANGSAAAGARAPFIMGEQSMPRHGALFTRCARRCWRSNHARQRSRTHPCHTLAHTHIH